jgi:formylglycine-generating enzyme required for sulfatase activity
MDTLNDFAVFRDIDESWCPEMIAVPAGEFLMGSPDTDKLAKEREKPQHIVKLAYPFALGRYAVTFDEYDTFCDDTKRGKLGGSEWDLRGRYPVTMVSWHDAYEFCGWLSSRTGLTYRLPSEAEWEYACRAGTGTRFFFGDEIPWGQANYDPRNIAEEVGSYPANAWGFHEMHGNTWEWLEDLWHENYEGSPPDGRAWIENGDQGLRVVRGGSPGRGDAAGAGSAYRHWQRPDRDTSYIGFRVARTL